MGYLRKRLFVLSSNIKQKITFWGGVEGMAAGRAEAGKARPNAELRQGVGGEAAGRAGEVVGAG